MREECLRRGSRKEAKGQGEAIPDQGAYHREGTVLLNGSASKRNSEETLFS